MKDLLKGFEDWIDTEIDKPHRFPTFYPSDAQERSESIANQVVIGLSDYEGRLAKLHGCRRACRPVRIKGKQTMKLITCSNWQMCPLCSLKKGLEMLSKYFPFFDAGDWHHLTIRFQPMSPYWDDPFSYWLAVQRALPLWFQMGGVEGVMSWEELTVVGLYPDEQVNPHVHAVVLTAPGQHPDLDSLAEQIMTYGGHDKPTILDEDTGKWRTSQRWQLPDERYKRQRLRHHPVILPVPVKDKQHFANVLKYMKPLNMLDAYRRDYPAALQAGDLESLHQNCRSVLDFWFMCHCDPRHTMQFLGKLRAGKGACCVDGRTRNSKAHWRRTNGALNLLNIQDPEQAGE